MKKIIIAIVAVILLGLFLSTFIEANDIHSEDNGKNIVISVEKINNSLNNNFELSKDDENIICATCRGLVKLNSSNEVVLDLAKDLDVSQDGIEYKFTLNDDIYWSNGEKIKADQVVEYFKSLIQNEENKDSKLLSAIYGVDKFRQEKVDFEKYVAITSEEDTVKIRLNKKDDNFLYELSKPQYSVRRNLYLWGDIKNNYDRIIYSGEYSISDVQEEYIELKNNYNTQGKNIIMIKDENKENSMASYEIGDRDVVIDVPISQVSRLDSNKRILSSSSGEGIYIAINSEKMNLDMRKQFIKILYRASQEYYDKNQKAVRFSEGSYFENEMDELDKLQRRKVNINNSNECEIPSKINIFIGKDDVSEDFVRFLAQYFKEKYEVNIEYSEDEKQGEFHMALLRLKNDSNKKNQLFDEMQKVFNKQNNAYFLDGSRSEENIFNSCIVLPVLFVNRNIAISDNVGDIKINGNGNLDLSDID